MHGVECEDGHDWAMDAVHLTGVGAERELRCTRCPATAFDGGQAALGDRRPDLDFTVDDLPDELR